MRNFLQVAIKWPRTPALPAALNAPIQIRQISRIYRGVIAARSALHDPHLALEYFLEKRRVVHDLNSVA